MKRFFSWILVFCLSFSLCSNTLAVEKDGFSNFQRVNTYSASSFSDVSGWYVKYIDTVYTLGLMQGIEKDGARCFKPNDPILLSEAVTLAARIHSIYENDAHLFVQSAVWYETYVDYAVAEGILSAADEYEDYSQPATRAQFISILARALGEEGYVAINTIEPGSIPDVDMEQKYSFSVYKLYRAGVLSGCDEMGSFCPAQTILRSEVAAIAARIVAPEQRQSFNLYAPLYVGFTMERSNHQDVVITSLTMTAAGETCYLTMEFDSQSSRFLSMMNASESLYILKVVDIEPGTEKITFTFPLRTLEEIYNTSGDPDNEKLLLEFYASGSPESVSDRFFLSIGQFAKYFDTLR